MPAGEVLKAAAYTVGLAAVAGAAFTTAAATRGASDLITFFLCCWLALGLILGLCWGFVFGVWFVGDRLDALSRRHLGRMARRGRCHACGYDLTGNVSGVCPECGVRVTPSRRSA